LRRARGDTVIVFLVSDLERTKDEGLQGCLGPAKWGRL